MVCNLDNRYIVISKELVWFVHQGNSVNYLFMQNHSVIINQLKIHETNFSLLSSAYIRYANLIDEAKYFFYFL